MFVYAVRFQTYTARYGGMLLSSYSADSIYFKYLCTAAYLSRYASIGNIIGVSVVACAYVIHAVQLHPDTTFEKLKWYKR